MFFSRKNKVPAASVAEPITPVIPEPLPSAKKILLVDDDAVTLTALSLKLKSKGYRVSTAQDGSQALTVFRTDRPDLMLLDVHFPPNVGGVEWNGFLIAEWLRRWDGDKAFPVIVMSGVERPEYKERAAAVGATSFLRKPLNSDELLDSVNRALSGKPVFSEKRAAGFDI